MNEKYQEANRKLAELRGDLADRQGRVESAKLRKPELLENISRWTAEQHLDGADHKKRIAAAQKELVQVEEALTDWPHIEQELQRRVNEAEKVFNLAAQLAEVEKLEAIHADMVTLSAELDAEPSRINVWLNLANLSRQAQTIYLSQLRLVEVFSEFSPDLGVVLHRWQAKFRQHFDDLFTGKSHPIAMPSATAELDLSVLASRIAALRRNLTTAIA